MLEVYGRFQLQSYRLNGKVSKPSVRAGPSGFEPETAGFLSMIVKSPVLYLAELRAQSNLRSYVA